MPSSRSRCGGELRRRGDGDIREQSFRAICDAAGEVFAVEPKKPVTLLKAGGLRQARRADAIFMLVEYETEFQLRFGRKIKKQARRPFSGSRGLGFPLRLPTRRPG
jgi:hypothetical protein